MAPGDVGLAEAPVEALRGGDAAHNADVARRVFAGEPGPVRDAVVLNAGMALAVASGLGGAPTREALVEALAAGVRRGRGGPRLGRGDPAARALGRDDARARLRLTSGRLSPRCRG